MLTMLETMTQGIRLLGISLISGTISQMSKRQPTVSLSSNEAQFRAAASIVQEISWLMQLMKDLHQEADYLVKLHCDNQFTIWLVENPIFHAHTKHVEMHYHYIKEKVLQGEIEMQSSKIEDQIANMLTKAFEGTTFSKLQGQFGLCKKVGAEKEC